MQKLFTAAIDFRVHPVRIGVLTDLNWDTTVPGNED